MTGASEDIWVDQRGRLYVWCTLRCAFGFFERPMAHENHHPRQNRLSLGHATAQGEERRRTDGVQIVVVGELEECDQPHDGI